MHYPGFLFLLMIVAIPAHAQQWKDSLPSRMSVSKTLPVVPPNYYAQHLGFFCKQELQLQKRTNVNVFFRLGSKDYVDYLERKPNARKF